MHFNFESIKSKFYCTFIVVKFYYVKSFNRYTSYILTKMKQNSEQLSTSIFLVNLIMHMISGNKLFLGKQMVDDDTDAGDSI